MKKTILICALTALTCTQVRAMTDDDLSEAAVSTDTAKAEEAADAEEQQAEIQESDEDLAGFVQDYVKKDAGLKGAFFLEDAASGRILKLSLVKVLKSSTSGQQNTKIVEAIFKDPAGKKHSVLFLIRSAGFGEIDISRIELKKEEKTRSADRTGK